MVAVIPVAAAIDRTLQCVASRGVDSSVLTITASTNSSLMRRGAPLRGSSSSACDQPLWDLIPPVVDLHHRGYDSRFSEPCFLLFGGIVAGKPNVCVGELIVCQTVCKVDFACVDASHQGLEDSLSKFRVTVNGGLKRWPTCVVRCGRECSRDRSHPLLVKRRSLSTHRRDRSLGEILRSGRRRSFAERLAV
jgi:hypothetical protein